jgi:hypothetical protein
MKKVKIYIIKKLQKTKKPSLTMKTLRQSLLWSIVAVLSFWIIPAYAQGPYPGTGDHEVCVNSTEPYGVILTPGSTYDWSILPGTGGGGVITGEPSNLVSILWTSTGTCTLQVVETNAAGCEGSPVSIQINVLAENTILLSSGVGSDDQEVCINQAITPITYTTTGASGATFSGLPPGVIGSWAGNIVTINGTPTVAGTYTYEVSLSGGCGAVTAGGTIVVNPLSTIALTSAAGTDNQEVCTGEAISNITYSTTGATGASFSGLPAGVIGNWSGNVVTISGTPTATGTFNYEVTLTGGCGLVTAEGTIIVNPGNTITLTSGPGTNNQSICFGEAIANITYTTTGATDATITGLPAGVSGSWVANTITISGTPSVTGTFTYTINLIGGCGIVETTGTINITEVNTINLTSAAGTDNQIVCEDNPIEIITYATTGAAGATITGLPPGVSGSWAVNVVTIQGTPTTTGVYTYTITLTGGCGVVETTGTITVAPTPNTSVIYHN